MQLNCISYICIDTGYLYSSIIMKYSDLKLILKNHQLRVTDCRMDILDYFLNQKKALSFKDLEDKFAVYDRVTLYRTLHSFTENGVLHKIPDDSGFATYGICYHTCDAKSHHHDHLHFKCNACGSIECLDEHVPDVHLPEGYSIQEINLIINGICKICSE